jgi:hypothetical protein
MTVESRCHFRYTNFGLLRTHRRGAVLRHWNTEVDESEFFLWLSDLLSATHKRDVLIGPDTDLLADGLIDSTSMLDIMLLGEEMSGVIFDPDRIEPDDFANCRRLYNILFDQKVENDKG